MTKQLDIFDQPAKSEKNTSVERKPRERLAQPKYMEIVKRMVSLSTDGTKLIQLEFECAGIYGNCADPVEDLAVVRYKFKNDKFWKRDIYLAPFDTNFLIISEEFNESGESINFWTHDLLRKHYTFKNNVLDLTAENDFHGGDTDEEYYISRLMDWLIEVPHEYLYKRLPTTEEDMFLGVTHSYPISLKHQRIFVDDKRYDIGATDNESIGMDADYTGGFCGFGVQLSDKKHLQARHYYLRGRKSGIGMHCDDDGRVEKFTFTETIGNKETEFVLWDQVKGCKQYINLLTGQKIY